MAFAPARHDWAGSGAATQRCRTARRVVGTHTRDEPDKLKGAESNRRHEDFQSCALPTELPGLGLREAIFLGE